MRFLSSNGRAGSKNERFVIFMARAWPSSTFDSFKTKETRDKNARNNVYIFRNDSSTPLEPGSRRHATNSILLVAFRLDKVRLGHVRLGFEGCPLQCKCRDSPTPTQSFATARARAFCGTFRSNVPRNVAIQILLANRKLLQG